MKEIQPGTRIGIGDNNSRVKNHLYFTRDDGGFESMCGTEEDGFTIMQAANVLNKSAIIWNDNVIPVHGNVKCDDCIKAYRLAVVG